MSFQAKRELLAQVAPRYQEATFSQKSQILDEFVAASGYVRKYAIRLLTSPVSPPAPIQRVRARRYDQVVQDALAVAWAAANGICGKRLVPFLPELVPVLEQHGHLQLSAEVRVLLLALSPATANRLLAPLRRDGQARGLSTTKPGRLLKHQVPIRTFNDWNETIPGFLEIDLVAHCGTSIEGAFLHTLTLTDVASGWTECLPLRHRSQHAVIQALDWARPLLPFPILGLDTDNGGEFLNAELLAYCEREHLTFTRSRAYKKNDQCYVEQKNGAVVRQFVGYDRFEGEEAYRQLTELYRAVRLYVNFFQPSMKLLKKRREGSHVHRTYDQAQTPWRRLLSSEALKAETRTRLEAIYAALDPVRLLQQLTTLQEALWRHAIFCSTAPEVETPALPSAVPFRGEACGLGQPTTVDSACAATPPAPAEHIRRKYHRTQKPPAPHWWRTRPDPFDAVWEEISQWLATQPERTAKSVLRELQQRYPGQFPDGQLRTLQRRVQDWRAKVIVTFDEQWLQEEVFVSPDFPRPLRAISAQDERPSAPADLLTAADPTARGLVV